MDDMTTFSTSDIRHLAGLSGLTLDDDVAESLRTDLDSIIGYVNKLDELDVSGVEPTYQVTDLVNVHQADEVQMGNISRGELLALAPDADEYQMKVPKVL